MSKTTRHAVESCGDKATAKPTKPVDQIVARVSAAMVRRAVEFTAAKDIRYYLGGVAIQPSKSGGVLVMASDGHTALVLHDPEGIADKPYILPFNKAKHAKALAERGAWNVTVSVGGRVKVTDLHGVPLFIHPGDLIDAKYPDLTKAMGDIGDYEMGLKGALNPEYVQRALDSTGKRGKYDGICFYGLKGDTEGNRATLFTTPNGFGLLMPLRQEPNLAKRITKDFGGLI